MPRKASSRKASKNKRSVTRRPSGNKKRSHTRRRRNGGEVIGAGGYGCVLSPPLRCEGEPSRPDAATTVSKLMETDDALQELEEINEVIERIKEIPDYKEYTLLDGVRSCKPDVDDIKMEDTFGKGCHNVRMLQQGYYDDDRMLILQMPKGGTPVNEYIEKGLYRNEDGLSYFMRGMADLLTGLIVPMNNVGVYNQDVKDQNILVAEDATVRLIDWGMTTINKNGNAPITDYKAGDEEAKNWFHRMPMFNEPLSAILMFAEKDDYDIPGKWYFSSLFRKCQSNKLNKDNAYKLVDKYLRELSDDDDDGLPAHISYMFSSLESAIKVLQKNSVLDQSVTLQSVIGDYVIKVFDGFNKREEGTSSPVPDADKFLSCYYHNIDLWGWAMSFMPILGKEKLPGLVFEDTEAFSVPVAKLIVYLFTEGAVRLDAGHMIELIKKPITISGEPYEMPAAIKGGRGRKLKLSKHKKTSHKRTSHLKKTRKHRK